MIEETLPSTFLHRRDFIRFAAAVAGTSCLPLGVTPAAKGELAQGADALPLDHFPSKLHAFVWRNWGLVPPAKLAATISASEDQLMALAAQMGLPPVAPVTSDQWERSYLTIIRRNWHLLPEDQLLTLLGWDAARLEFTLKEDDFFFIKLGSQKPKCETILYSDLEKITPTQLESFQHLMKAAFPNGLPSTQMPYFQFVKDLSAEEPVRRQNDNDKPTFKPAIAYPYFALFGDTLLDSNADSYPDGYLDRLAASGVDSIWMHVVLSKLTPFPWDKTVSEHWEQRLDALNRLTQRARQHGIGVYLYLNEPRHPKADVFERHPELKGQGTSLCTSVPEVQSYLRSSIAMIVERAPMLAGFFSITASENPTHCWSHFAGDQCPRCSAAGPGKVIADLNNLYVAGIAEGHQAAQTKQPTVVLAPPRLIVWDWGWRDGWVEQIIPALSKQNTALMSVSEWDLPIERAGISSKVGEYSISSIGPGPRAQRHWKIAREHGIEIIAKIQANNTWEIGAVPYIPAVHNVAQHIANLRAEGVGGLMLGWTLGGCPSPNLDLVSVMSQHSEIAIDEAILQVARTHAGPGADALVNAWKEFSTHFSQFPYHIDVVYFAPLQCGPANLLSSVKTGFNATMVGIPYDDLDRWRAIYPREKFIEAMRGVGQGIQQAAQQLQSHCRTLSLAASERQAIDSEIGVMQTIAIHYQSVANQSEFINLRDQGSPHHTDRLREILHDESALALRMAQLQCADSRLGYEASNHYFYVPMDLYEKALNCQHLHDRWLPA